MGLFSTRIATEKIPWTPVRSVEQLRDILNDISDRPKVFFKHSTRCMTSSMALNSFQNEWQSGVEYADLYFVDLLNFRDVSNEIATLTGVRHESPQVIVIKGKEIIYEESHSSIDARRIEALVKK